MSNLHAVNQILQPTWGLCTILCKNIVRSEVRWPGNNIDISFFLNLRISLFFKLCYAFQYNAQKFQKCQSLVNIALLTMGSPLFHLKSRWVRQQSIFLIYVSNL